MSTKEQPTSKQNRSLQGVLSFAWAMATAGSVAMIGFTSFTAFNPPGWLRIVTMAPLPFLIILSTGFGVTAIRKNSGRVWAIAGVILTALAVVAFIIMINIGG